MRHLSLIIIVLATVGCHAPVARHVTLKDVDHTIGTTYAGNNQIRGLYEVRPRRNTEPEFRISWVEICARQACDSDAKRYADLFREAALASATVNLLAFAAEAAEVGPDLRAFAQWRVPALRARLSGLERELEQPAPNTLTPVQQRAADAGRPLAWMQLAHVKAALPTVERWLTPEQHEEHELAREAEALTARVQRLNGPGDRVDEDDVLRLATRRGLTQLQHDVALREAQQESADALPSVQLRFAHFPASAPGQAADPAVSAGTDGAALEIDELDVWSHKQSKRPNAVRTADPADSGTAPARWTWAVGALGAASLLGSAVTSGLAINLRLRSERELRAGQISEAEANQQFVHSKHLATAGVIWSAAGVAALVVAVTAATADVPELGPRVGKGKIAWNGSGVTWSRRF